jgi:hypothetical protein
MRLIYIIMLIALIMASGCLGEKTVIKANVTITEHNGTPIIESIDVTSVQVSKVEDYREVSPCLPGVNMKCISNMRHIDYWRSVDYNGSGEYELISELRIMPDKGEGVNVIIEVVDSSGNVMAKRTETSTWE